MATLKITISIEGEVAVGVEGVKGESCRDLTKSLEMALGTVTSDEITGEYCETEVRNDITNRA